MGFGSTKHFLVEDLVGETKRMDFEGEKVEERGPGRRGGGLGFFVHKLDLSENRKTSLILEDSLFERGGQR